MFKFNFQRLIELKLDYSWLVYAGLWGIILGMGLEFVWHLSQAVFWWVILSGFIIASLLLYKVDLARFVLVLIIGVMLGQIRFATVFQQAADYRQYFNQEVELSGRLADDVSANQSGAFNLRLTDIRLNHRSMVGRVLITTRQKLTVLRGDIVTVRGKLEPITAGYNARIRLLKSIEVVGMGDVVTQFRDWLDQRLHRYLPKAQAGLVSAILLGKRVAMGHEMTERIRTVGLSHMVVASGLHLMIIVAVFRKFFRHFSRRDELIGSLLAALIFALTAGLSASMLRALMALGLLMSSWYVGRQMAGWRVLSVLVAISLLFNPLHLNGDLSWWLSYGAFFAVLVAVPAVTDFFFGDLKLGKVRQLLLAVIVVQLVLAPILLVSFGELSLISIVANLLVVPLVVVLMWLASAVILLADINLLAWIIAYPLQLIVHYILNVIALLAEVPLAIIKLSTTAWQIGMLIGLIILAISLMSYKNYRLAMLKLTYQRSQLLSRIQNSS